MNDLIRPSLYGAYQQILNCTRRDGTEKVDIVGPVCESGDFFAKDRDISITEQGDCICGDVGRSLLHGHGVAL